MNKSISILFIAVIGVLCNFSQGCLQKFKRAEDLTNFTNVCFTKVGFASVPTTEEIQKSDFDDKCAAKCILNSFELVDDQGRIDKDTLSDFLEENVSPQILLKLNEMATTCVDSSGMDEISGGTKTGTTPEECKPIGKFYSCFVSNTETLC